jgi:hypothetical protein
VSARAATATGRPQRLVALLVACLLLGACALLSDYDPTSYRNATDLKAESLSLLERATEPYAEHAADADRLRLHLRQAYEYEKGKGPSNAETAEQWRVLGDERGRLVGGALKQWKSAGQLGEVFLQELCALIERSFDEIITLEQGKVKP